MNFFHIYKPYGQEKSWSPFLLLNNAKSDIITHMKYSEINLKEDIKKALNELGFNLMTKIQEESYEHILNGKDVVGMSSTGSGKTAAFMIPTLERVNVEDKNTQVLVVTPTRELAIQIVQETRKYLKYTQGINALAIYGGQE